MIEDSGPLIHCPACGGTQVRLAHVRKLRDWFGVILFQTPYRCHECRHRFYEGGPSVGGKGNAKRGGGFARWRRKQDGRLGRLVAIALFVLAAVLVFFHFLTRPPAP
ncbi:hypothetical protein [Paludibaculum fermentans]|uniref:hypothetical protein n=1 Tax=Paludibaculum fermentans TaxID=1473598 RepID=UPI003EBFE64D